VNKSPAVAGLQHAPSDSEASTRLSEPRDLAQPPPEKRVAALQNQPASTTTLETKAVAQISPTPTTKDAFPYNKTTKDTKFSHRRELQPLLGLLRSIGEAYYNLCHFCPRRALEAFNSLPVEQQASPWVLSKLARTQYELHSYEESKLSFQVLRSVAPSWTEDLDFYSTVLWHLKDDVTLAHLAHDLTASDYLSPQTWCAIGNCFSIQKLSREAIKCFRRACKLSPPLPQAFSLLGYEYIEAGEYVSALTAFNKALDIEPRHYLAWVGLGRVLEKEGDHEKALKFYLHARKINHNSPLLMIYVARVSNAGPPRQLLANFGA
jgi:anaphase-promoting complex subunit 3